jgi:hypothetical protein
MTGWNLKVRPPEMLDVFACNYYKCPFIGLKEEFHFNPSVRNNNIKARVLSECPHCGQLGCHSYGSIFKTEYRKYGLRLMRWQYRYFLYRDGSVGITSEMRTRLNR